MKTKRRLKKKVIIIPLVILIFAFSIIGLYGYSMKSVSKEDDPITFIVQSGASKKAIVNDLETAGLIKNKYALLAYLYFNSDIKLQAGKYELNRNMNATDIINKISSGDVKIETVSLTFVEGKTVRDLIKLISDKFNLNEDDIKASINDKEYIEELIEKYDFLTDEVLNGNIYYALEGYLYPDTYTFLEDASVRDIITTMLDNTKVKLASLELSNSSYTIHEILTMASIVELEGANDTDRAGFAQVIYKRLELGMTLGMDTTTYYAAQKSRNEGLTLADLNMVNPYNTRTTNNNMAGKLPIGPIANPSVSAINAVLNPSDTNYIYFVANTCTGETFFNETYEAHLEKSRELKSICATN